MKFINKDASSIHGNLKVGSVYTSESGEWKLGGFEVLSGVTDDEAIIYVCQCPLVLTRTFPSAISKYRVDLWKHGA